MVLTHEERVALNEIFDFYRKNSDKTYMNEVVSIYNKMFDDITSEVSETIKNMCEMIEKKYKSIEEELTKENEEIWK